VRWGANLKRLADRNVRREAVREVANTVQGSRVRPVARPVGAPQRVMPRLPTPTPPPVRVGVAAPPASGRTAGSLAALKARLAAAQQASPKGALAGAAGAGAFRTLVIQVGAAHPEIAPQAGAVQANLSALQSAVSFADVEADITNLDSAVNHALSLLEAAREKGYAFQKDLEDLANQAAGQWESIRQQVLQNVQQQASGFQGQLIPLGQMVERLNYSLGSLQQAPGLLQETQSLINQVASQVNQLKWGIESSYSQIETDTQALASRLTVVHWALDQLAQARFTLERGEDLVMAAAARWDKQDKDDPEGILYLTNKRLVFERKEKVATKKILFIVTASELVHEVLIDQPVANLSEVKAASRGLFGHQDFLEVKFKDPKLGVVPFHLNGQESTQWDAWVRSVQTGAIEQDRAAATGVSVADITGPLTPADLVALQGEVNELQDELMLKDVRDELESLENELRSLERKLTGLRGRGYLVEKSLEGDAQILALQWERVKANAVAVMEQQSAQLSGQRQSIQQELSRVLGMAGNLAAAKPVYIQLKSAIASAEAQADAAEDTVFSQFDAYDDEVDALSAHLDWIDWMLDALETASFRLLATESGVAATEAVWLRPGLEPENGVLFLTDQRLLWEDRVGAFELKLDMPLARVLDVQLETSEDEQKQTLVANLETGAPLPTMRFELALPVGDDWIQMISRAKSGGYAEDRAVPLSEEEVQRVRNAPTQCPNCGGALTAPILRGQTEITCEYCAVVTRL
jgi:predicted  nucleic acid-binding Zn-ribbon protein